MSPKEEIQTGAQMNAQKAEHLLANSINAMNAAQKAFQQNPSQLALEGWRREVNSAANTANKVLQSKGPEWEQQSDAKLLLTTAQYKLKLIEIASLSLIQQSSMRTSERDQNLVNLANDFLRSEATKSDKDYVKTEFQYFAQARLRLDTKSMVVGTQPTGRVKSLGSIPDIGSVAMDIGKKAPRKVEPIAEFEQSGAELQRAAKDRSTKRFQSAESDFIRAVQEYNQLRSSGQERDVVEDARKTAIRMYERYEKAGGTEFGSIAKVLQREESAVIAKATSEATDMARLAFNKSIREAMKEPDSAPANKAVEVANSAIQLLKHPVLQSEANYAYSAAKTLLRTTIIGPEAKRLYDQLDAAKAAFDKEVAEAARKAKTPG